MSGPLVSGARFARRYEIERVLKSGGMGAVYVVLDTKTRRRRALKIMLPSLVSNPDLRERFAREATVAADVHSEHIVETFDAGVDDETGAPFIVMELLRGADLDAELERRGRFPPVEVVALLFQVALALDKTHAASIVHRDLKPANLFLTTRDDGSPRVLVLDFGVAKAVAEGSASEGTSGIGTPIYMPPEQLTGGSTIGPASDLYALAHVAFALLTGAPYWNDELVEVKELYPLLSRIMLGAKESATARAASRGVELPAAFDAWFTKGTAKESKDRFVAATSMIAALANALGVVIAGRERIDPAAPTERDTQAIAIESAPTAPIEVAPPSKKADVATPVEAEALATQHAAVSAPRTAPSRNRSVIALVSAAAVAIAAVVITASRGNAPGPAASTAFASAPVVDAPRPADSSPREPTNAAVPTTTPSATPTSTVTVSPAGPPASSSPRPRVTSAKSSIAVTPAAATATATATPAPAAPPPRASAENLGF